MLKRPLLRLVGPVVFVVFTEGDAELAPRNAAIQSAALVELEDILSVFIELVH